jgi:GNAT superfamily N-acetyltransferase
VPHGPSVRPDSRCGRARRRAESAWWDRRYPLAAAAASRQAVPVTDTGVRIQLVDVTDDRQVADHRDVLLAAYRHVSPDHPMPSLPELLALVRAAREAVTVELWVMYAGTVPVATYLLSLPQRDNTGLADLRLGVHPEHQHRGYGRALVDHLRARCAQLGLSQVNTEVHEPADGSQNRAMRFAAATGAIRSLGEIRRVLELTALDRARLAALRAEAEGRSGDYELVAWTGPCPDDLVDAYAALMGRMSTDAPTGDTGLQAETWDAARIRERDAMFARQERIAVATGARERSSGRLVAYTDMGWTRHDPENAFQWDTLVLRKHRGHRLGVLVKVANLERLLTEAPDARRVHTWNAEENTHMIAINDAMGFVPRQRESVWRLNLGEVAGA